MSNEKRYPDPNQLKDELDRYFANLETEEYEKVLKDIFIVKAKLKELGVEVPAELQEQFDELGLKNPVSGLPKWVIKNKWIEVLESRRAKLQIAMADFANIKPIVCAEFQREIDRINEKLEVPQEDLGGASRAQYAKSIRNVIGLGDGDERPERVLIPKQARQLLATLETRFHQNQRLHKGVEWSRVKSSFEANLEALWSINEMEKAGHVPDVYRADDEGFDVGSCCKDSSIKHRDVVYDAQAAKWLRENHPDREFNGSAVELAEAMGIELMNESQYKYLQKKGEYDKGTWSWLKTPLTGKPDFASCGARHGGDRVRVAQLPVTRYHSHWAFRGSLRVLWS